MKKVDVLFVYETRVRELESICLLKTALELRGYSTAILNTWNAIGQKVPPYDAKVVVAPSMYNNGIYDFLKEMCGAVPKVVNLQWEQIGPVGDEEREDAWYILKDLAKQCMHICWGPATYERLQNRAGIDVEHLCLAGQPAFDFCKPEYRNYYESKEAILERFGIPADKELNLFISSFSYVDLPERLEKESLFSEVDAFIDVSCNSFAKMLEWFDRFLSENPSQALVYRPHPSEAQNDRLMALAKKYPEQLFVIGDLSVKQWIAVSDRIYTWFSTASAEAYAFGKPIAVLRPIPIPLSLETSLLQNVEKVDSYEAFVATLKDGCCQSLSEKDFLRYYRYDETPAYVRIADAIEKVYRDDAYLIVDDRPKAKVSAIQKIKTTAHNFVGFFADRLPKSIAFLDKYRSHDELDEYSINRQRTSYVSGQELSEMQAKIMSVFFAEK